MTAVLSEMARDAKAEFVSLAQLIADDTADQPSKDRIREVLSVAGKSLEELEKETEFQRDIIELRAAHEKLGSLQDEVRKADVELEVVTNRLANVVKYCDALILSAEATRDQAESVQGGARYAVISTQNVIRELSQRVNEEYARRRGSVSRPQGFIGSGAMGCRDGN
jgi:ABC-type transporter Mla subunit MlaD